jgi:cyclopropane-fatty-acyl-phospholipid synthase
MKSSALPPPTVAPDDTGAAILLLTRLFPSPRPFDIRLWDGSVIHGDGDAAFTLVIASAAALRAMFRPPVEASLGDAFLAGDLEIEGDICAAFPIVDACRRAVRSPARLLELARLWWRLPAENSANGNGRAPASLTGGLHTPDRDRAAVRYHYDLGNDFFALFLDRRMVYSAGYFPTGDEDLDSAQEKKLDHICRKLRLEAGERLLDVGCGWGALLIHAAGRYGVRGTGITLSEQQHVLVRERVAEAGLGDRIEIRLLDYRDLREETWDKVSSVGMFEHVGRERLPEYFARIFGVLRPGGLFLNHGISERWSLYHPTLRSRLLDPLNRIVVGKSPLTRSVFPDTELIPLSEVNSLAEAAGWEVRDVENLREHYALTLRRWIERLEEREEEAVRLVGTPTFRAWRLYFALAANRFERAQTSVNQTLLAKLDGGRAGVPLSRANIYA